MYSNEGPPPDDRGVDRFNDDMVCYAIAVAARLLTAHLARELIPLGLAPGQVPALLALDAVDGLTQANLARMTSVEQPTMAVTLRRMERDGLIRRAADHDDARRTRLHLTDTGRDLIAPMKDARTVVDTRALRGIPASDLAALSAAISRIVDNLAE